MEETPGGGEEWTSRRAAVAAFLEEAGEEIGKGEGVERRGVSGRRQKEGRMEDGSEMVISCVVHPYQRCSENKSIYFYFILFSLFILPK